MFNLFVLNGRIRGVNSAFGVSRTRMEHLFLIYLLHGALISVLFSPDENAAKLRKLRKSKHFTYKITDPQNPSSA